MHTNHPSLGYEIVYGDRRVVWAPEFWSFPGWAAEADPAFIEAAAWNRPTRFRGGVGGHAPVQRTLREAQEAGIRHVVFVHIGRPTIGAIDAGDAEGLEFAKDGQAFELRKGASRPAARRITGAPISHSTDATDAPANSSARAGCSRYMTRNMTRPFGLHRLDHENGEILLANDQRIADVFDQAENVRGMFPLA